MELAAVCLEARAVTGGWQHCGYQAFQYTSASTLEFKKIAEQVFLGVVNVVTGFEPRREVRWSIIRK